MAWRYAVFHALPVRPEEGRGSPPRYLFGRCCEQFWHGAWITYTWSGFCHLPAGLVDLFVHLCMVQDGVDLQSSNGLGMAPAWHGLQARCCRYRVGVEHERKADQLTVNENRSFWRDLGRALLLAYLPPHLFSTVFVVSSPSSTASKSVVWCS